MRRALVRSFRTAALLAILALLVPGALALAQGDAATPDAATPLRTVAPADAEAFAGAWEGEVRGPGTPLGVIVRLEAGPDGAWRGTIDVPAQGAEGVPLRDVEVDGGRARFTIAGIPGEQTFTGELSGDGASIEGEFTAYGQTAPFVLERRSEAELEEASRRPQEPVPPLPYDEVELTYEGPAGTIAGTLVVPEGEGPFPAALLISGSGAQDRDSTLAGHRPFLVLADALARAGVATLRADDRGVGGTEGDLASSRYEGLVEDLLAGLETLRERPEVDAERVGVIGHSEGGFLAPMVAARAGEEPAFAVLLAAPAVGGLEVLELQNRLLYETSGATEAETRAQVAFIEAWGEAVLAGDLERARELTRERVREQYGALPEEARPSEEELDATAEETVRSNNSPYVRDFVAHDPGPYLRELDVPTLAIYGGLDVQVPAAQNAGRMSGWLRVAGNPDVEVRTLPGLNHLLQPARTGGIEEYAAIETTIAPEALEAIASWLEARFVR